MSTDVRQCASATPPNLVQGTPYKIVKLPIKVKGEGLVAARDIKAGEVVIREAPIWILNSPKGFDEGYEFMKKNHPEWLDRLYFHPKQAARFRTVKDKFISQVIHNSYQGTVTESKEEYFTLYLHISKINHSCMPNVSKHIMMRSREQMINMLKNIKNNSDFYAQSLFAVRDIKKGEEICLCYHSGFLFVPKNQRNLKQNDGFDCICNRCMSTPTKFVESKSKSKSNNKSSKGKKSRNVKNSNKNVKNKNNNKNTIDSEDSKDSDVKTKEKEAEAEAEIKDLDLSKIDEILMSVSWPIGSNKWNKRRKLNYIEKMKSDFTKIVKTEKDMLDFNANLKGTALYDNQDEFLLMQLCENYIKKYENFLTSTHWRILKIRSKLNKLYRNVDIDNINVTVDKVINNLLCKMRAEKKIYIDIIGNKYVDGSMAGDYGRICDIVARIDTNENDSQIMYNSLKEKLSNIFDNELKQHKDSFWLYCDFITKLKYDSKKL